MECAEPSMPRLVTGCRSMRRGIHPGVCPSPLLLSSVSRSCGLPHVVFICRMDVCMSRVAPVLLPSSNVRTEVRRPYPPQHRVDLLQLRLVGQRRHRVQRRLHAALSKLANRPLHRDSVRTGRYRPVPASTAQYRPLPAGSTCCLQLVHGSARRAACGTAMVCAQTSAAAAHRTTSRRSRHIACTSYSACVRFDPQR